MASLSDYFKDLKGSDWINLANLGTNIVGGLTGGKQDERAANLNQAEFDFLRQQDAYKRAAEAYARRMAARSGIGAALQDQALARRDAAQSTLDAMPLGAEQDLVRRMARARGMSTVAEHFQPLMPTDPSIASTIRQSPNMLSALTGADYRQSISPEATARSIAERRKAIAGVNPDFVFGSMGDYGGPDLGAEVTAYGQARGADRLARENQLMQLLTNQMQEASKPLYQEPAISGLPAYAPGPTSPAPAAQKGTPWWKKALKVASVAAPIVAAPFTGGTSLAAIGALSGAVGGALDGGKKGALQGALLGGATSAMGGGAAGAAAKRGQGEAVSAAIKRAVLNPRALTNLTGAGIGGTTGAALQGASAFLPGATAYNPNAAYNRHPVEAEIPPPRDFTPDILKQAGIMDGAGIASTPTWTPSGTFTFDGRPAPDIGANRVKAPMMGQSTGMTPPVVEPRIPRTPTSARTGGAAAADAQRRAQVAAMIQEAILAGGLPPLGGPIGPGVIPSPLAAESLEDVFREADTGTGPYERMKRLTEANKRNNARIRAAKAAGAPVPTQFRPSGGAPFKWRQVKPGYRQFEFNW